MKKLVLIAAMLIVLVIPAISAADIPLRPWIIPAMFIPMARPPPALTMEAQSLGSIRI